MARAIPKEASGKAPSTGEKSSSGPQRKPQRVLGVEAFAQSSKKGVVKALHSFRARHEKKRRHVAQKLRQYSKVMKQEGYVPGQGASRKRSTEHVNGDSKAPNSTNGNEGYSTEAKNDKDLNQSTNEASNSAIATELPTPHRSAKKSKSNPFQKSLQKAEQRKEEMDQKQKEREEGERRRRKKLRERRQRTQQLSQRTRKGQPVMQNVVHDILQKLAKQEKPQQPISAKQAEEKRKG
jgi:hypothetical protein